MPSLRELTGWYTTAQAADAAGTTRQTVIDAARDGWIRAAHVGSGHEIGRGVWIYDPESVAEYAERRRERGASA